MRIAVMGSGGVGGYFGARLAKGGADVAFVARGSHLAAMREHGLTIAGPDEFHLPKVTATDDPASIGIANLVIFAVKLWDTEAALAQIGLDHAALRHGIGHGYDVARGQVVGFADLRSTLRQRMVARQPVAAASFAVSETYHI